MKKKFKFDSEAYIPATVKDLLLYLLAPYKWHFALFFFLTGLGVLCFTASTYVASLIISNLGQDPTIDGGIWRLVTIFAFLVFFDEVFWRVGELFARSFKPQMTERLRTTLYKGVVRHSHEFFVNANSGRVAHWVNSATETFGYFLDTTFWTVWGRLIGMIIATVFLFTAHWSLAVLFVTWLVLLFWYNMKRGKRFAKLVTKQSDETSLASGLVADTISNNMSLRVFNSADAEVKNLERQQNRIIHAWRASWLFNVVTNAVKGQSAALASILAMLLGLWLFSQGTIGLGSLVLFLAYFSDASSSLWQLAWAMDAYYRQFGTLQNVLDGLRGSDERQETTGSIAMPDAVSLKLNHVSFAYPERPKELVLRDISLSLQPGEKLGIVGHSGAGKSTLIGLLLGFYEPTKGKILINEVDVATKSPTFIRQLSAFVPQDTSMFNRTIKENVTYAKPGATDEALISALKQAQAYDFVQHLPDGLQTLVGERGVKLSGGQRQRIAIARAILKDAPLLLLDEATSALDSVSEQAIQKALHKLMKGRTSVVIAHRLSTLKHLDRIVVIDKGVIIEDGTHDELLAMREGVYTDLWRRQKDGFIVE